jgi:hypothetical protein
MTHPKPFGELSRAEKGELLLAHHEGKRIEQHANCCDPAWMWVVVHNPLFCDGGRYRIAPEPLIADSINWDHVDDEVNAIARQRNGAAVCFEVPPEREAIRWDGSVVCSATVFASYKRGTVDWKESLVIRPGHEGSKP